MTNEIRNSPPLVIQVLVILSKVECPFLTVAKEPMDFRVELEAFRGPLDLLLYLVRKEEVEITDLPIAPITEQYLAHLEVLQHLDVNGVGEFLELASTLVEIKSRMVLPQEERQADEVEDPRDELVERLLEYKKYKDAATILEEQSRYWQQRYPRLSEDLPPRRIDPAMQPIREVELWDLVSALGRMMRDREAVAPAKIIYDDTPINVYMEQIHHRLIAQRKMAFSELFQPGMHKSAMVGVFLAILELSRHHGVRTEQEENHGEIWVIPGENFSTSFTIAPNDEYNPRIVPSEEMPLDLK